MIFLSNMLMTSWYMLFDIPLDLIYEQWYPLHVKTTSFCFTFVLAIVNPLILFLVLKITWWELLNVNVLVKLLGIYQAMNYFKVSLRFPHHSICLKCRFDTHKSIELLKYSFSWIRFPRSLICKNFKVNSNLVLEFKFATLDMFLKIKPHLGSIWKYDKLKLWHFC